MKDQRIRRLSLGGVLASVILLLTYVIKIPVPATGGYVHLGDGAIFFAAVLMGPYAALIGGVGSALSDLLGGYFVYILPTFFIKALMGGIAGQLARKGASLRNALVFSLAAGVMVMGYFVFEGFFYGWSAALAALGPNCLQGVAGVLVGMTLSALPIRLSA